MPKVFIHYFSGTGNTKRAVDVISENLKKNNFEVKQLVIGETKPVITEKGALHIFAFSILSWSAPVLVKKYLRRLPRLPQGEGAKAALIAVYAGDPGQALVDVDLFLKNRQYDVFLSGGACYPNNWSQMTNPPDATKIKDILDGGDQAALDFSNSFIKGERKQHPSFESSHSLTRMIAFFFSHIGRRFLGKMYIADSNCNRCELCIKTCPVHTIKMTGIIRKKPSWRLNCEDCGRCINICPQKAIQVSIPRLVLHVLILIGFIIASFPLAGFAARYIPVTYRIVGRIGALVIILFFALWLQFAIIDRLIFFLEQIPAFKGFFEKSSTKKYNRYIAPGFKPDGSAPQMK
jgi:Pyruvate/2-oxoacid:ferredoxin oxidoreductase delta subunit